MPIRVAVVEDDEGVRQSLTILLNGSPGFRCVSAPASAEDALRHLAHDPPDVVLMDIKLPRMSGVECVRRLKHQHPGVQIIMLTAFEDDELVFDSLVAGASGYLLKRTPPAEILEAVSEVHRGGSPMSSAIARKVVQSFQALAGQRVHDPAFSLSPREAQLLRLLARGHRYKEIADDLGIALDTVRSHIRRIYEKLHVTSRTEAVVKFLQQQGPAAGT